MIKAIIFDFDGVLFDTEPLHFAMFQTVFQAEGITLAADLYHAK
ncbi:MAG: HAD family phosphatase, partial [Nitrospira sp.]|nr:HAD family phosphatase [Nitrospira sp.]